MNLEQQLLSEGKYLAALANLEKELQGATPDRRVYLSQKRAWFLSFCGDEAGALSATSGGNSSGRNVPPAERILNGRLRDAREEILRRAEKQQVVVLNEAHHISRHRAFGMSLLEGLRQRGFTHFAAEAFASPQALQTSVSQRTMRRDAGYYMHDTVFAAYAQKAMELGLSLVPYEAEASEEGGSPEDRINARERAQANNLYERIFKSNPRAKVLIHVGYDHVRRSPVVFEDEGKKTEVIWMAGRLTRQLGIPLLTVDQTGGTEAGTPAEESAGLRGVLERRDLTRPALVQKSDRIFLAEGTGKDCDLTVFHPRMRLRKCRPDWLFHVPGRREVTLPPALRQPIRERVLVQAVAEKAPEGATDTDRCLITPNAELPVLVLPRGRYRLYVQDEAGNQHEVERVTV